MKKILMLLGTGFFLSLALWGVQMPRDIYADEAPVDPYVPDTAVAYAQVLDYYTYAVRTKLEAASYAVKEGVDCAHAQGLQKRFLSSDTGVFPYIPCQENDSTILSIDMAKTWKSICENMADQRSEEGWKSSFAGILTNESCLLYDVVRSATEDMMSYSMAENQVGTDPASPSLLVEQELQKELSKFAGYVSRYQGIIQRDCVREMSASIDVLEGGEAVRYAPKTYASLAGNLDRCKTQVNYDLETLQTVSKNLALVFNEFVITYPQHVALKKTEKQIKAYMSSFQAALSALEIMDERIPGQTDTRPNNKK